MYYVELGRSDRLGPYPIPCKRESRSCSIDLRRGLPTAHVAFKERIEARDESILLV